MLLVNNYYVIFFSRKCTINVNTNECPIKIVIYCSNHLLLLVNLYDLKYVIPIITHTEENMLVINKLPLCDKF